MASKLLAAALLVAPSLSGPVTTTVATVVETATTTVETTAQYNTASHATSGDNHPSSTEEVVQPTPSPHKYGGEEGWRYHSPAFLPEGWTLEPSLPRWKTNGDSKLGFFDAPKLPEWLGGSPLNHGRPWGSRSAEHTNQYQDPPNTGVTRHYEFNVSRMDIAPDGVVKNGLVVNGQFPGPTIEANWGDYIEVIVHNNLEDEGTSIHWHGLLQKDTPYMDGVPSVQQCPIAPGSSFTYRFKADLYGSSWWHSHYSAQYAGGIEGPMIIYGPNTGSYDEDLGPIFLTDWYHDSYYDLVEQVMAPADQGLLPPMSNNNLINGKMNYPCANTTFDCTPNAGIAKFKFESGKKYRLRLINGGAEGIQKFSIDGMKMTVIQNDYVPIEHYVTDLITLGVGQRTDVVVEANGKPDDAIWMRSTLGPSAFDGGCTLNDGISPEAVAAIYYENANTSALPTSERNPIPKERITQCFNDPLDMTVPSYKITPPEHPATQQVVNITRQSNGTHNLFYMNNSTFRANYNEPTLLDAKLGKTEYPSDCNIFDFQSSSSIRLIVYNFALTGAHPMHMHGHNMYILASGTGYWNGTIAHGSNPQRRDVQLLENAVSKDEPGYIVVQIDADNPGVWPFHCHIAWHVSEGLYLNMLERPDEIRDDMAIPGIMAQTCRDWSAWTGENVVDEIDSGL
ncbi:multicopper oxidase [Hortaea werneckii]|uniref:Multicopper oxidase n=1 Tax=Hortaea werneckii TaxID=91943 RepID=A0A3M7F026_HORWE|nr:multicopper oxidase [Hortaea werneckii]RMY82130.1 hypothetical protein D0861_08025 [Hortaea werneckii]